MSSVRGGATMPSTNGHGAKQERVALYMRVSSEEQRERETIEIQDRFLSEYCRLYGLEVAGAYADDGVSRTLPLHQRTASKREEEDTAELPSRQYIACRLLLEKKKKLLSTYID